MTRIKNMSRGGWIVIGILIAMMLVPSGVAVAKVLKDTGIEGTSMNKADVTPASQLLVAEADPNALFQSGESFPNESVFGVAATAPPSSALIITTLHVDIFGDPSPGVGQLVEFDVETGTTCGGSEVGSFRQTVNPPGLGEFDTSLAPGVAVPSGDVLCVAEDGSVLSEVSASGYIVPSAAVSAGPVHPIANVRQ
jgi:hypothetical protein